MSNLSLIDLIPVVNSFILVFSFLHRSDNVVRYGTFIAALLQFTYFIFYEMYNSSIIVALTCLRSLVAIITRSAKAGITFIVLNLSLPFLVNDTDYICVIAGIIGTTAFFFFEGWKMRLLLSLASYTWYLNNITEGAYSAALFELFASSLSLLIAIKLYKERNFKEEKNA